MEEIQIVLDVQASPLSKSMQHKLNTLRGNTSEGKNCTIFRTPQMISQSKKNLFEPTTISIGPFHRGQKHLRAMEEQKWRFLQDFLSRGDHISLDLCISEMKSLEERTRRCYSETFDDLDSDTFAEMMLLDGCFLLEYFLKFGKDISYSTCDVGWISQFIPDDFLLLENQIPFFIVEKLCEIGLEQEDRNNLINNLIRVFDYCQPSLYYTDSRNRNPPPAEIHHLVHLCYHCFVPNLETPIALSSNIYSTSVIPSATELKQKGLKFKEKDNLKHILEISFKNGVLKIPKLRIRDCTKLLIANLIAFEHSKYGRENKPFTSFVAFLDNLVNTPNDVKILQECGIIENLLGSEEELAHFINQVNEGTSINRELQYLAELYREVNRYSESSWNRHRAKLIRDYFSSPWAAISLVAALILLVLTGVQSFYAVYAYKFSPSS